MHTYCLKLSFLLFALLLLTGCNNDIFIDDTPPSSSDFEIAIGEGKEVTFATDYLRSIQLQLDRFSYDWTTYNEYGYTQTGQPKTNAATPRPTTIIPASI